MFENRFLRWLLYGGAGVLLIVIAGIVAYPFLPAPTVEGYLLKGAVMDLSANAPFSVEFSQRMDKSSVEKELKIDLYRLKKDVTPKAEGVKPSFPQLLKDRENFEIEENVEGDLKWDGKTLVFAPTNELKEDEIYRVSLSGETKSILQKKLDGGYDQFFHVVEKPKVVMVTPADDSTVPTDTKITVQFNRPMVSLTTLSAGTGLLPEIKIEPELKGRYKWLGTKAFQFIPEKVGFGADYKVTIPKGTLAADGGAMEEDYSFTFHTPGPELMESRPENWSNLNGPDTKIFLTFNQPMDLKVLQEKTSFFVGGDEQKEVYNPSLAGVSKESGHQSGVGKAILDVLGTEESNGEPPQISVESLKKAGFQSVDFTAREASEEEYKAQYRLSGLPEEDNTDLSDDERKKLANTVIVQPKKSLPYDSFFFVGLSGDLKGLEGTKTLGEERFVRFQTVKKNPVVSAVYPKNDSPVYVHDDIQIVFTNPMDEESLKASLAIEPKLKDENGEEAGLEPHMEHDMVTAYIYPRLQPATKYTVTVKKGAKDIFGNQMTADYTHSFTTTDLSASFSLEATDDLMMMNAHKKAEVYMNSVNVSRIEVKFKKMEIPEFEAVAKGGYPDLYGSRISDFSHSWTQNISEEKNQKHIGKIDFKKETGFDLVPGIYYVEANAPDLNRDDYYYSRQKMVFLYSKSALAYKAAEDKILVWATDVKSGQPVKDMQIVVKTWEGSSDGGSYHEAGQGHTNENGLAEIKVSDSRGEEGEYYGGRSYLIYGFREGDITMVHSSWNDGISPWNFNIESGYGDDDFYAYIYTDRPIYRPEHTVYFKGIIRAHKDASFSLPSLSGVPVIITDSFGNEVYNQNLTVNKNGTFNGEMILSGSAASGDYTIRTTLKGKYESDFYGSFKVAEYRKPDYKITMTPDREAYANKETARVKVNVDYYFGSPLSDADVNWTLKGMDYYFNEYEGDWFSFSEDGYFCYWGCEVETAIISGGRGKLDENGEITVDLPLDITEKKLSQIYTLEVTARDITKRSVSNRITFPVHQGEYYVGINNRSYVVKKGDTAVFDIVSVDYKGQPMANKRVKVAFQKREWNTVRKKNVDGGYYYTSGYEDTTVEEKEVVTGKDGKAEVTFAAENGGMYQALAESVDGKGNRIAAASNIYVGSGDYVFWGRDNNDRIELVPDKQEYKVGDTAKVLIKSPYQGVKALVTYERANVLAKKVIDLDSNSQTIEIPITGDYVPNVFVSVVIMKGSGQTAGITEPKEGEASDMVSDREIEAFKVGYTTLFVDTLSRKLTIGVSTDREKYGPGDEVTIKVQTAAEAEVSISVVDESVLALTDTVTADLINYFYRKRYLNVDTAASLTRAIARINVAAAAGMKGGGGGPGDSALKLRSKFQDTAQWTAELNTDKNGYGEVKFKLPDNLTTWQILAIGATNDTKVGSQKKSFLVTKDVLIQPVLPRFLLVDDQMEIGVVLHNKTDKNLLTNLNFTATGVKVDGYESGVKHSKQVAVSAQDEEKVTWQIKVLDGKEAKFRFETDQDAVEMTLPVKPASIPEVVATSGTLDDGKETEVLEKVWLPNGLNTNFGELKLTVAPTLAASIAQGADYLLQYPYGCAEQTASSLLPNLVLKRILDLPVVPDDLVDVKTLDKNVAEGVQRLYMYQNANGGWGLWEDSDPTAYLTSYVLFTLNAAKSAGYTVDGDVIKKGVSYLKNHMNANSLDSGRSDGFNVANSRAYGLFVLAELKEGDLALNNNLYDNRASLGIYGKALLAMSFDTLIDEDKVTAGAKESIIGKITTLKNEILNEQLANPRTTHFEEKLLSYYSYDSNGRTNAFVLQMLSRIDPQNPVTDKLLRYILESKNDGYFRTTQETSITLLSLIEYLYNSKELDPSFTAEVSVNEELKAKKVFTKENIDHREEVIIAVKDLLNNNRDNEVKIKNEGKGRLYYDIVLKYFLPLSEVTAREEGFTVSQEYYAISDEKEEAPLGIIRLGQPVKGKITVVVPEERYNAIVEDLLPAGLEGIDFGLATSEHGLKAYDNNREDSWYWWNPLWYFNHDEVRDDRIVYFADRLPAGTYEITYFARATSTGTFHDLPASASEMYMPEVFGRTGGRTLKIVE